MSRPGFAQIGRLELHHLGTREMAAPLQSDQQLLDFVELYIIACEARDMMRERVARRPDIGHMVLLGHLPDAGGGCAFGLYRTWILLFVI